MLTDANIKNNLLYGHNAAGLQCIVMQCIINHLYGDIVLLHIVYSVQLMLKFILAYIRLDTQ